jgi:hypothetical protein
MADIIYFSELFANSRDAARKAIADALVMAEEARRTLKSSMSEQEWRKTCEHADPRFFEALDIAYPWEDRPYHLTVDEFELEIIFGRLKLNFEQAARKLRITETRLEAELLNSPIWRKLAQARIRERNRREKEEAAQKEFDAKVEKQRKKVNDAITVEMWSPQKLVLRIPKPPFRCYKYITKSKDGKNLIITIVNAEFQDLINEARANAEESK